MEPKLRSVVWAEEAVHDLERIIEFIALADLDAAGRWLASIRDRARSLVSNPERGRMVPELRAIGVTAYRELVIRPYRLLYRIEPERVVVVAIFDGRRDLADLLLARLIRTDGD